MTEYQALNSAKYPPSLSAKAQIPFALLILWFVAIFYHASFWPLTPISPFRIFSLFIAGPITGISAFTWFCICCHRINPAWLYYLALAIGTSLLLAAMVIVFLVDEDMRSGELCWEIDMWMVLGVVSCLGIACVGTPVDGGEAQDVEADAGWGGGERVGRKSCEETVFGEEDLEMDDYGEDHGITGEDASGGKDSLLGDGDEEDSACLTTK